MGNEKQLCGKKLSAVLVRRPGGILPMPRAQNRRMGTRGGRPVYPVRYNRRRRRACDGNDVQAQVVSKRQDLEGGRAKNEKTSVVDIMGAAGHDGDYVLRATPCPSQGGRQSGLNAACLSDRLRDHQPVDSFMG